MFRGWAGQKRTGRRKRRELDDDRRVRIQLMSFDSGRDNMLSPVYCVQKYSKPSRIYSQVDGPWYGRARSGCLVLFLPGFGWMAGFEVEGGMAEQRLTPSLLLPPPTPKKI